MTTDNTTNTQPTMREQEQADLIDAIDRAVNEARETGGRVTRYWMAGARRSMFRNACKDLIVNGCDLAEHDGHHNLHDALADHLHRFVMCTTGSPADYKALQSAGYAIDPRTINDEALRSAAIDLRSALLSAADRLRYVKARQAQNREAKRLLAALAADGWKALSVLDEDSEEWEPIQHPRDLMACDDAHVRIEHAKHGLARLYLVWGNGAGELVCDHTDQEELSRTIYRWSEAEERLAGLI